MAGFVGRPAKDDDAKRNRMPNKNDWVDVADVPFDGPTLQRLNPDYPWMPNTLAWWEAVRQMPHCALWGVQDWMFAAETALLVQTIHSGDGGLTASIMGQLTRRELEMGMTEPSRRQQRIRYVEQVAAETPVAPVQSSAARRERLRSVGA